MAITVLNTEDFETSVLNATVPVLVDFFATWCGPCKMIGPILEQVATEMGGDALIYKIDVDNSPELASKYGVMSVPTLIVFKDGEQTNRVDGVRQKNDIIAMLK